MDDILIDLLEQRKQHILRHRTKPQTIRLTRSEEKRFRVAMKKQAEEFVPPLLSSSEEIWRKYEELRYDLENTDRIFGMQIEVVT